MILLQAGHEHIQSNCLSAQRGGTGAPGEITWTPQICDLVVAKLADLGIAARHVDANFNCTAESAHDFEAFVAVHYQSDPPHESGYYVGPGNPESDGAAAQSARLSQAIQAAYRAATRLEFRPEWDSDNIRFYYMFNSISAATPFTLIECGTGAPGAPDHVFLWSAAGMEAVSIGIAIGIAAYMGVVPSTEDDMFTTDDRTVLESISTHKIFATLVKAGTTLWLSGPYHGTLYNVCAQDKDAEVQVLVDDLTGANLGHRTETAHGNSPGVRGPIPFYGDVSELGATGPCTLGFENNGPGDVYVTIH